MCFPHSWEVTSDSIAAFMAGALGAARLALIKPAVSNDPVDRYFRTALPAGMPCLIVSWERLERAVGLAQRTDRCRRTPGVAGPERLRVRWSTNWSGGTGRPRR